MADLILFVLIATELTELATDIKTAFDKLQQWRPIGHTEEEVIRAHLRYVISHA